MQHHRILNYNKHVLCTEFILFNIIIVHLYQPSERSLKLAYLTMSRRREAAREHGKLYAEVCRQHVIQNACHAAAYYQTVFYAPQHGVCLSFDARV